MAKDDFIDFVENFIMKFTKWGLSFNSGGDCLYEFQNGLWVLVHGCDLGGTCNCEGPPASDPILELQIFSEIVRKPCVASPVAPSNNGIDAVGFLFPNPFVSGKLHCIRSYVNNQWVHYYYDLKKTKEPPVPRSGINGLLHCTNEEGDLLAVGVLADISQLSDIKGVVKALSATLSKEKLEGK